MEIRVDNLTMSYSDAGQEIRIFSQLSFTIPSGSSLAIIGESGVGKTTLLYLLGGLEHPQSGEVVIGGKSLQQLQQESNALTRFRGEHIGLVFQFHYLLPEFNALENVAMPLLIRGESLATSSKRAEQLLRRVGLGHRLEHRPGMLSGGEQQRVAVARAVASKPGVVLADEPTGNLDHKTGREVAELLLQFQREEGMTLILVTHSHELARLMDRQMELSSNGLSEIKL